MSPGKSVTVTNGSGNGMAISGNGRVKLNVAGPQREGMIGGVMLKALELHPDQNQSNKEEAEAKFRHVMDAYNALRSKPS
ncbi:hypothetical protein AXG93_3168s1010 [Marchantia polymorpha subsp. ruderalis]|uniref:J domain-containing protein n=1 Tax=Marchantia polymorpha subsp. ruderalis TaxID=1480154 RepID=A0A176WFN5_MARPO|nr:hypothetical protein AXG93_3168s1010 [Marchantia polymorpha subsp. ruderalis]